MSEGRPTGWEGADRWFSKEAGGTGGGGAAEEPPPVVPPCQVCGAGLEADQTYCLECGSPTPLAPRLHRGAGRTVLILAGAAVILGLGAGALAFAVVRDDGDGTGGTTPTSLTGAPPLVPTGPGVTVPLPPETGPTTGSLPPDTSFSTPTTPVVTAPGTTGFPTVTGPASVPTTEATTTEDTTTAIVPTTSAGGASDWPAGRTAWTAILASTHRESDARAAKSRVAGGGDPAGVLFSTDFAGLRPGYWVVFSGTYASRNTAIAQAVKLRPDFPSAYARRIEG